METLDRLVSEQKKNLPKKRKVMKSKRVRVGEKNWRDGEEGMGGKISWPTRVGGSPRVLLFGFSLVSALDGAVLTECRYDHRKRSNYVLVVGSVANYVGTNKHSLDLLSPRQHGLEIENLIAGDDP